MLGIIEDQRLPGGILSCPSLSAFTLEGMPDAVHDVGLLSAVGRRFQEERMEAAGPCRAVGEVQRLLSCPERRSPACRSADALVERRIEVMGAAQFVGDLEGHAQGAGAGAVARPFVLAAVRPATSPALNWSSFSTSLSSHCSSGLPSAAPRRRQRHAPVAEPAVIIAGMPRQ